MSEARAHIQSLPPALKASDAQQSVMSWARAYGHFAGAWLPSLREMAEDVMPMSAAVREDLVQEAMIRLWELDPSRFDESDHERVMNQLKKCMRTTARTERRRYGHMRRVEWADAAAERPGLGLMEGVDECY